MGEGHPERPDRLRAILHERTGAVMPNPASRDLYARHLAALRARLDAATLAREWAAGRAMPLDEAIGVALEETA